MFDDLPCGRLDRFASLSTASGSKHCSTHASPDSCNTISNSFLYPTLWVLIQACYCMIMQCILFSHNFLVRVLLTLLQFILYIELCSVYNKLQKRFKIPCKKHYRFLFFISPFGKSYYNKHWFITFLVRCSQSI